MMVYHKIPYLLHAVTHVFVCTHVFRYIYIHTYIHIHVSLSHIHHGTLELGSGFKSKKQPRGFSRMAAQYRSASIGSKCEKRQADESLGFAGLGF